jgi:small subunit ribosomal protein S6
MRRYETIVIVDADVSENDRVALFNRIQEIIPQQEGVLIKEDLWGTKKLAYEIKKKPRGYYARYDYCGMGPLVDELERFFRIDDRVLKYLTVLLDSEADAEKIQAELAAAETAGDTEVTVDQTQPSADDASPADQESQAATEATESATESIEKE